MKRKKYYFIGEVVWWNSNEDCGGERAMALFFTHL